MRFLQHGVLLLLIVSAALPAVHAQQTLTPNIHPPKKHKGSDTVGVVNGTLITYRDFKGELKHTMSEHISEIPGGKVSDSLYTKYVNLTWDKMVGDILIEHEIRKRKISVSKEETVRRILRDPPEPFKQSFTDSLGAFHQEALKSYIEQPAKDSLRDGAIAYYQSVYEQDEFTKQIAPHAVSDAERKNTVDEWIHKRSMKANIDDRRTAFGFY
jgi:hypothetical protein